MRTTPAPSIFRLPAVVLAAAALSIAAVGVADAFAPTFTPEIETARAGGGIAIDGVLDDAGWSTAAHAGNFSERYPGENVQPPVDTQAMITYDDDNLYVAFICEDDPAAIRATMCQRDQWDDDDAVGLMIDTFGEATWAYEFFVNPYGIQVDQMWTSVHGEDRGFDLIWNSAAKITDDGYIVEMSIPLAALRFPDREEQSWRVDFWRFHPRDSDSRYSWAADNRNEPCWPCKWGTVNGIRGVSPGRGLEILPEFVAYRSGAIRDVLDADSGVEDRDVMGEPSLGAKYSVSSDVTLEATLNPDFSQIEADAAQIDVNSTIVQMYPERRPFFQEGSDLFRTHFNSFYTRTVNAPEMAAKATARWDRTSAAFMLARDEMSPYVVPTEERSYGAAPGKSTVNVLRVLHSLGNNSSVGVMGTDRRYEDGGVGTILAGDFNLRLSQSYSWVGQYVHSRTEEPEGFALSPGETFDHGKYTVDLDGEDYSGAAFITELRRRSRDWNFTLDYNHLDPTYRTQTGYDPWNDQRNAFAWTNYNFYPEGGPFERVTPTLFVDGRWNMDGRNKWRHAQAALDFNLRWAQSHVGMRYQFGEEVWSGIQYDGLWELAFNVNSRPHDKIAWFAAVQFARNPARVIQDEGDETAVSLALEMKPIDRLIIEPTLDYIVSDDSETGDRLFRQTIARARLQLQVNPRLSMRLVLQHTDTDYPLFVENSYYHVFMGRQWEVDPLLTYRVNSFSVFFLGSTHDWSDFNAARPGESSLYRLTDRQYFMKLQYLFQT